MQRYFAGCGFGEARWDWLMAWFEIKHHRGIKSWQGMEFFVKKWRLGESQE